MSATPEQMTLCKWCDRVAPRSAVESESAWIDRKEWELQAGRALRPLSHGICPTCVATVLKGLYEVYGRPKANESAPAEDDAPRSLVAFPPGGRSR